MKKLFVLLAVPLIALGCQRGPSEVVDKVMADFGLREAPEGYVSGTDQVMERLDQVGKVELKRLNQEGRYGEVEYEEEEALRGKYYKVVRKYEDYYPLDAQPVSRTSQGSRGYHGYVEYRYQAYRSPLVDTQAEAEQAVADIPTNEEETEVYRYTFNASGIWDGGEGERTRR